MAIIDFIEWNPEHKEIFAWKFPETNLSTKSQLLVRESQEAVLFKDGVLFARFGPGRHTLSTKNIPILRNLFGIPFGGNNPFKAEVWYLNQLSRLIVDWKVGNIVTHDADYNTMIPLAAHGTFSIKLTDMEVFLKEIVGSASCFDASGLKRLSTGEFNVEIKTAIYDFINRQHVGYKRINSYVGAMSENVFNHLSRYWTKYGITLSTFYVIDIVIDKEHPAGQKIEESIMNHSSQSISGYSWQQAQAMEIAKGAVSNMGQGQGGLLGAVLASGMLSNMGGAGRIQPVYDQPSFNSKERDRVVTEDIGTIQQVFCSNCSKKFPNNAKFCPHCGDPYRSCPVCKADNPQSAKRCVSCGRSLDEDNESICPGCEAFMPAGSAFCPRCGYSLLEEHCVQCGSSLKGGKFCPSCGKRAN